jgi:CheY-like chemotaxis protein
MVRDDMERKQIVLTLRLDAERHMVNGDDVRLQQVFWNVIKNAVKFTPVGGQIAIESRTVPDSDRLVISVTDTGIGMLPEELARIFKAFSQGNHAMQGAHRFGGLGLGLAISRMMMELHGGSITASSSGPNQGTTFLIELPLRPNGEQDEVVTHDTRWTRVVPDTRQSAGPCHVLLVEDHKPTSRALMQLLLRRNYQVVAADSVAEARAAVRRQSFELLISDIGLPDGNGYELMAELRTQYGLTGIALSGYGMEEDVSRSEAAGFVAHLIKPVSVQALDGALAAVQGRNPGTPAK